LQAVSVEGGVAGNVVPDVATLVLNARFAPDRTAAEARSEVEQLLRPHLDEGDGIELTDAAEGAPPSVGHPLLRPLVERFTLPVNPKLGWTDVARFARRGIAAVNFGPGDPIFAHTIDEHVDREELERVYETLTHLLSDPSRSAGSTDPGAE
jgi:succinyl-diaminopimelate desuccinylase